MRSQFSELIMLKRGCRSAAASRPTECTAVRGDETFTVVSESISVSASPGFDLP